MSFDKRKFVADPRACILPKGETFGDRRYRYKNYWCLSSDEKRRLRESGAYPHNTPGIPDSAYAYPIDKSGKLALRGRGARRTLIWSRQHVISRRAGQGLLGGAKKESYAAYKRRQKRIAERARRTPGFIPYRADPYERD